MNWLKAGIIMAASVVLLLYFTRPSRQDVEEFVHAIARSQILAEDLEKVADPAIGRLRAACSGDPHGESGACREALGEVITITYRNRIIYADVAITGLGPENRCHAFFNQLVCNIAGGAKAE